MLWFQNIVEWNMTYMSDFNNFVMLLSEAAAAAAAALATSRDSVVTPSGES